MKTTEIWDELMDFERRFEDMVRTTFPTWTARRFPTPSFEGRLPGKPFLPAADTYTKDGDLVVRLDLPGIDPDKDVTVAIEDGDLVVRGERTESSEVKEEDYYRKEACYGAFERRMSLPEGTKDSDITPEYTDGVLEIHIKAPALKGKAEPKRIPVKAKKA